MKLPVAATPFGAMEMGGMFSVVKVREGLGRNDYKDPGWYQHPAGTVAYEWTGEAPPAVPRKAESKPGPSQFRARKPAAPSHNH